MEISLQVSSPHNAIGYFTVYGEETNLHTDHFNARLAFGDTMTRYCIIENLIPHKDSEGRG